MSQRKKPIEKKVTVDAANRRGEPSIHIAIDAKGNIVLETVGTTGNQCDLLVGSLEANLGVVTSRTNKQCYEEKQSRKTESIESDAACRRCEAGE